MPRPIPVLAAGAALGAVVATVAGLMPRLVSESGLPAALLAGGGLGLLAASFALLLGRRRRPRPSSWLRHLALAIVSSDGRWLRVSRRLASILGTTPAQLRGQRLIDHVHPRYREPVE